MKLSRGLTAGFVVAGIVFSLPGMAAEDAVEIVAGFEGIARVGAWTPVAVRLSQGGEARPRVFVWAEDADGDFVRSPPARWRTDASGGRVAETTVRCGRPGGRLRIDIDEARHEAGASTLLPSWQRVVLVLGELPSIDRVCRLLDQEGGARPRPVKVKRPRDLGRTPLDFDAADAIVVCGSAIAERGRVPEDVLAAIDGWVRRGGHLLLLAGPSAGPVAAAGGAAARWLPGPVEKVVPLRRTAAVETYARSPRPLEASAGSPLVVPRFLDFGESSDAVIDAFEGNSPSDLPLLVRRAHGFGTIAWAAFEPDLPPLQGWSGTDSLLARLLGTVLGPPGKPRDGPLAGWTGTADLADQLRRAIDTFPGASPVPFEWIAVLAGLYVVTLYPAGWWAVDRLKRRSGRDPVAFAWLLLPASVAAFTVAAVCMARSRHPGEWRQSRCDLLDLDAADGGTRAFSFSGTWSPENRLLERSIRPQSDVVDAVSPSAAVSWFAAAGGGLGATDSTSPHPSLAAADYAFGGSLGCLERVPVAAFSSRLFEATWHAARSSLGRGVAGRLDRDAQGTIRGRLESRLPFALKDCLLAHAGWLYDVGDFAAGRPFDPAAGRGPRSLAGSLTRRGSDRERDRAIRYDASSRDASRILEVAGLHGAAGGPGYTSLEGGRIARLDLSSLLATNRAILIGNGPAATAWLDEAAEIPVVNDRTHGSSVSVWRIVIPLGVDIGGEAAETSR